MNKFVLHVKIDGGEALGGRLLKISEKIREGFTEGEGWKIEAIK